MEPVLFSFLQFFLKRGLHFYREYGIIFEYQKTNIAGWSSLVARRAHNPKVEGSSPSPATRCGGVAQLARAFGSYPECHWFESSRRYQTQPPVRHASQGGFDCRKSPPAPGFSARSLRNVCAQGRKLPARPAPEGSASPVGCCRQRRQSDPKVGSETSGGRGQRPPRRLSDREKPGDTNSLWSACGPSKPPQMGSESPPAPGFCGNGKPRKAHGFAGPDGTPGAVRTHGLQSRSCREEVV